jgi:hypothetical protein
VDVDLVRCGGRHPGAVDVELVVDLHGGNPLGGASGTRR